MIKDKLDLIKKNEYAVKYYNLAKEKTPQVVDAVRFFDYAKLTYFPFIGWIYPFAARSTDEFVYFHAKQAFALAVLFTGIGTGLTVLEFLAPFGFKPLKFALIVAIYLSHLVYFGLCIRATLKMLKNEKAELAFLKKYIDALNV